MQCLRCKTEMKHYELNRIFNIRGAEYQPNSFSTIRQEPHNPHSIYICDNCGYVELSTK